MVALFYASKNFALGVAIIVSNLRISARLPRFTDIT